MTASDSTLIVFGSSQGRAVGESKVGKRARAWDMSVIRMQTPLEEIPLDKPSLIEDMLTFLSRYTTDKELFNAYEKDRTVLMRSGGLSGPSFFL